MQESYVAWIIEARNRFQDEVLSLASKLQDSNYLVSDFEKAVARFVDLAYIDGERVCVEGDQLVADRDRLSVERDQLVADRDRLSVERDQLVADLNAIESSIIWKFTYPVRILGQFIRKLLRNTR
jgi:hypothetical protein